MKKRYEEVSQNPPTFRQQLDEHGINVGDPRASAVSRPRRGDGTYSSLVGGRRAGVATSDRRLFCPVALRLPGQQNPESF